MSANQNQLKRVTSFAALVGRVSTKLDSYKQTYSCGGAAKVFLPLNPNKENGGKWMGHRVQSSSFSLGIVTGFMNPS